MKRIFFVFILIICIVGITGCDSNKEEKKSKEVKYMSGKHNIRIEIEKYGTIDVELDADAAPITVTNFINLVNKKYYDGLKFHRIIKGFMMQGGDGTPKGKETKSITGEFEANGVDNTISHKRGVISMARAMSYDSGSDQFFIVHKDSEFLDGNYAGFGHVTSGIEVVDKICKEAKVVDDNGTVLDENQPVIKSIRVIEK